jgi:predicted amidophosphoribosyltransferase
MNNLISLELHHLDGNSYNHILSNLIILCPNCHSQYDKLTNKKITKGVDNYCLTCGDPISYKARKCCKCNSIKQ